MHEAQHTAFRQARKFGSLDGLRALCILAVVWHHSAGDRIPGITLDKHGYLGVDFFFVISGFLIVTLLLRERERTGTIGLFDFYVRRALRIFPLYYAVVLLLALAAWLDPRGGTGARALLQDLPYLLSYTGNWVHLESTLAIAWSLAAEEQFYLVWPALERYAPPPFKLALGLGFLAANQLLNFGLLDGLVHERLGLPRLDMLQVTFTPICLGVALAHLLHSQRSFEVVARFAAQAWAGPLALAVLVLLAALPGSLAGLPRLAIQVSMACLLAACVVREAHPLARVLQRPWLVRLGAISYGVYLLHKIGLDFALRITRRLGLNDTLWLFGLCLGFSIVLAEVSYRFFETPFLRAKARFEPERSP